MNDLEPIAVALKFGFLAVLYLFLLWVTRTALRDLGGSTASGAVDINTGFHDRVPGDATADAFLVVADGAGLTPGDRYDLFGGVSLGRSPDADIRLGDRYASGIHVRVFSRSGSHFVEDMNSTNGTLLNSQPLHGEAELSHGDVIRIGDTELTFEAA